MPACLFFLVFFERFFLACLEGAFEEEEDELELIWDPTDPVVGLYIMSNLLVVTGLAYH